MRIQIEELNGMSAYAFCRHLKGKGEFTDEFLEVWRGNVPAYRINSILEGASLMLVETSKEGFKIRKWKGK